MSKKIKIFAVLICILFIVVSCRKEESVENGQVYFNAVITEINNGSIKVEVTDEMNSGIGMGAEVTVSTSVVSAEGVLELNVGDPIRVVFNGEVRESYPLQLGTVFAIYRIDENGEVCPKKRKI